MARLRSWGLLCFAVLALPGPPGAGAQGKGMRGAAGDGPRRDGGVPARHRSAEPSATLGWEIGVPAGRWEPGGSGAPTEERAASVIFAKPPRSQDLGPAGAGCSAVSWGIQGDEQQGGLCSASPFPRTALSLAMGGTCCSEREAESVLDHIGRVSSPGRQRRPFPPLPGYPRRTRKRGVQVWGIPREQLIP